MKFSQQPYNLGVNVTIISWMKKVIAYCLKSCARSLNLYGKVKIQTQATETKMSVCFTMLEMFFTGDIILIQEWF